MSFDIIAFVLAIAALLCAVGALITFARAHTRQRLIYSSWQRKYENLGLALKQTTGAALAVEQAALAGAVEKLAKSMRSQFGTINGKLGALEELRAQDPATAPRNDGERPSREELRATYLRPPFKVGGTGGD